MSVYLWVLEQNAAGLFSVCKGECVLLMVDKGPVFWKITTEHVKNEVEFFGVLLGFF